MILFPNAKINLGLRILRRRPDGYHDVATAMVPVDWCDVLEIVPADGSDTTLTITGRAVDCPPEKNLVMKAVRALGEICTVPPADIHLHKVIPDGAGMGGGSADAAFTLIGLNEVFGLSLTREKLAEVAARIGADCPFFVWNAPALCTGIGTEISPLSIDLSAYTILIAKQEGTSVSTAEAYAGVVPHEVVIDFGSALSLTAGQWAEAGITNDFEASVIARSLAIGALKQRIAAQGALYTAMTGSGAAVFGIFNDAEMAEKAARSVEASCPDTVTKVCRCINSHPA